MPCIKCANGKWKYGEHGNCQFDTLSACKAAAAAIHINDPTAKDQPMDKKPNKKPVSINIPSGPHQSQPSAAPATTSLDYGNPQEPMAHGPRPDIYNEDLSYMLEEHYKKE